MIPPPTPGSVNPIAAQPCGPTRPPAAPPAPRPPPSRPTRGAPSRSGRGRARTTRGRRSKNAEKLFHFPPGRGGAARPPDVLASEEEHNEHDQQDEREHLGSTFPRERRLAYPAPSFVSGRWARPAAARRDVSSWWRRDISLWGRSSRVARR